MSVSLAGEGERKVVKEIVKRANHPVKARLIPPDILAKYQKKLAAIEPDVQSIIMVRFIYNKTTTKANSFLIIIGREIRESAVGYGESSESSGTDGQEPR